MRCAKRRAKALRSRKELIRARKRASASLASGQSNRGAGGDFASRCLVGSEAPLTEAILGVRFINDLEDKLAEQKGCINQRLCAMPSKHWPNRAKRLECAPACRRFRTTDN